MENLILNLIKTTDPIVLITIVGMWLIIKKQLALVKKDIERIDKAVNHREEGQATISQEVSEINKCVAKLYTKIEVHATELNYLKEQVQLHREEDEKIIKDLTNKIVELSKKPAPKRKPRKAS